MRNILQILWAVLGVALLAAVIWWSGPAEVLSALAASRGHPWLLAAGVGLFAAAQATFLLKWHWMSRRAGAEVRFRQSLRLFGTLMLVGTFTPGRAGELAVPLLMRGGTRLTGTVIVNRLLESTGTICAGLFTAVLLLSGDPRIVRLWNVAYVLALLLVLLGILSQRRATAAVLGFVRRCLRPMARWRPVAWLLGQEQRWATDLEPFYEANERILRPWPILIFAALMVLVWMLVVSANYALILATLPPGAKEVTFLIVLSAVAVSAVAMFVSPIPGGLGLSEFTVLGLFAHFGYQAQLFVPFLLLVRVALYVVIVLLYLLGRFAGRDLPTPAPAAPVVAPS